MQVDPGNAADKVEIVNIMVPADGVGDVVEFDPQAVAATASASTTRNLSNLIDFSVEPRV